MKDFVNEERIPRCKTCKGLVKPDIVFFGESVGVYLPKRFTPDLVQTVIMLAHPQLLQIHGPT